MDETGGSAALDPLTTDITIPWLRRAFEDQKYICGDEVIVPVYLALMLQKPLLVEGAPGVGKTEIAKVLASILETDLVRLQCYEGLDESKALYEWNYQKQILRIQMAKDQHEAGALEKDIFSEEYLLGRPLLHAIRAEKQIVLLIDEVDRTDEEFEAFLFEVLSDFQVSIPELGTIKARHIPVVVLTSNRARELSDALRRRCIFLFIDFPSIEKETRIIRAKVPGVPERLAREVAAAASYIRAREGIRKLPSVAETLDWARALVALGMESVNEESIRYTLNLLLKNKDDLEALSRPEGVGAVAAYVREQVAEQC